MFAADYVVAPTSDKRNKEYKEFIIANASKKVLTQGQSETIEGIAKSVAQHTSANTLLKAGLVEHSIIWQDEETGVWLKIRPDCLCIDFDTGICLDVKKTTDASRHAFKWACERYYYDLQAAVYLEGLKQTFRKALNLLKRCRETNHWPLYQPEGDYELLDWRMRRNV